MGVRQFAHLWLCRQVVQYAAFAAARATLPMSEEKATWLGGEYQSMTEEEIAALEAARKICALLSFTQPPAKATWSPCWFPDGIGGSGAVTDASPRRCNVRIWDKNGGEVFLDGWRTGKMAVAVTKPDGHEWSRQVAVAMDVPLLFPIAGSVIGRVFELFDSSGSLSFEAPDEGPAPDTNGAVAITEDYDGVFPHFRLREAAVIVKPFAVTTTKNLPEDVAEY